MELWSSLDWAQQYHDQQVRAFLSAAPPPDTGTASSFGTRAWDYEFPAGLRVVQPFKLIEECPGAPWEL